jgi:hypothetical protein
MTKRIKLLAAQRVQRAARVERERELLIDG